MFRVARLEPREVLQRLHAHLQVSPEKALLASLRGAVGLHVSADRMLPLTAHTRTLAALCDCVLALDVRRAELLSDPEPTMIFSACLDRSGAVHANAVAWSRESGELRVRRALAPHFAHVHPHSGSRKAWWVVEPQDYRLVCVSW
jgi:hypothetical protein